MTLFASTVPSHDARMLALLPALLLTAAAAPAFEPELRSGETLEARVDGDLDGDGTADTAWLTSSEDKRELVVHLTDGATEALTLETTPLGPGELSIDKGVLLFEDLTGGTTAIESKRRYRYDKNQIRMRLIGYDATLYSRTQQHDGFEVSEEQCDERRDHEHADPETDGQRKHMGGVSPRFIAVRLRRAERIDHAVEHDSGTACE